MMNQAPGAINFTMFLTLFGERLQGTDPEDVIRNAFACFDEANAGNLCFWHLTSGIHNDKVNIMMTGKNHFIKIYIL